VTLTLVYRVVDAAGRTVREYVDVGTGHHARLEAIRHAARLDGRVFHVDHLGYLELVFGLRERARE